jgi:hypothetical protein
MQGACFNAVSKLVQDLEEQLSRLKTKLVEVQKSVRI